jgi:hypothetical protein
MKGILRSSCTCAPVPWSPQGKIPFLGVLHSASLEATWYAGCCLRRLLFSASRPAHSRVQQWLTRAVSCSSLLYLGLRGFFTNTCLSVHWPTRAGVGFLLLWYLGRRVFFGSACPSPAMADEGSLFNFGSVFIMASLPAQVLVQQWLTTACCWLFLILASLPTHTFVQQWLTRAHCWSFLWYLGLSASTCFCPAMADEGSLVDCLGTLASRTANARAQQWLATGICDFNAFFPSTRPLSSTG